MVFKENFKKISIMFFVTFYVFSMLTICFASSYVYNKSINNSNSVKTEESSISSNSEIVTDAPVFEFQSYAQVLIEPITGKVLYSNNENERLYPASVTKIMSLILIMEEIDSGRLSYTDKITCSANASGLGGSQIWFKEGEQLTVDEALKCIVVVSANDVTIAMAEHIAGSEENFVSKMNAKAKELGMVNTNFVNSHGLHDENHYTTSYDVALMSKELLNNHPDITKYTTIWMDTIRNGEFGLSNTNKLVRFYEGTIGLKTGSTPQAMYNLSAAAKRNNTTFIAVVMKTPTGDIRNEEAKQLLNYAFANFQTYNIKQKNDVIETKKINKSINDEVNIVTKDNISILSKKGNTPEYEETITYYNNIKAPIKAGTEVGEYTISLKENKEEKFTTKLILENDILKSNLLDYYYYLVNKYMMII